VLVAQQHKLVKGLVQVKDSKKVSMMAVMILKDLV